MLNFAPHADVEEVVKGIDVLSARYAAPFMFVPSSAYIDKQVGKRCPKCSSREF
jgi:hypothetical protein